MQRPEGSTAPALAFDTTNVVAPQAEGGPAVEPSPIAAANKPGETSKEETLSLGPTANEPNSGTEIASAEATAGQPTSASSESTAEISPQPQQPASESPPAGGESTTAAQAVAAETPQTSSASNEQNKQQASVQTSPPEKPTLAPAPAKVSTSAIASLASRRLAIVGGLLLAAIIMLAWVIVPVIRRHAFNVPRHMRLEPPTGATAGGAPVFKPRVAPAHTASVQDNGFVGGPRQVSVELKPWQAPLRHTAVPGRKLSGAFDRLKERRAKASQAPARREPERELTPVAEPDFESVGPVVEQTPEILQPAVQEAAEMATASATTEFGEVSASVPQQPNEISQNGEEVTFYAQEPSEFFGDVKEPVLPAEEEPREAAFASAEFAWPAAEPSAEFAVEPVAEELPDQIISTESQFPLSEPATESVYDFSSAIEPVFPQTTTPATMPETTQTPIAPIHKAPAPPMAKPQPPAAAMQTSVQLTFSFEIAAMQLTPSFKMGVLKVRPISKLVTMRLPSPQRAQSALNLQVAFEDRKDSACRRRARHHSRGSVPATEAYPGWHAVIRSRGIAGGAKF